MGRRVLRAGPQFHKIDGLDYTTSFLVKLKKTKKKGLRAPDLYDAHCSLAVTITAACNSVAQL